MQLRKSHVQNRKIACKNRKCVQKQESRELLVINTKPLVGFALRHALEAQRIETGEFFEVATAGTRIAETAFVGNLIGGQHIVSRI